MYRPYARLPVQVHTPLSVCTVGTVLAFILRLFACGASNRASVRDSAHPDNFACRNVPCTIWFGPSAPIFGRSTRFYFLIFLSSTEGSRQLCDHLSIISHESKESKMMKQSSIRGGIPVNKRELGDYTETEFLYFSECREKFLGDDVVERGMISQEKFADAYSTSCVKFYSEGNSCPGPNFSMFPESLQTVFYGAACKSMSDPSACGMNLNSLPMKIGYIVSRDEMPDVQMHVEGMCLGMMDQVFRK